MALYKNLFGRYHAQTSPVHRLDPRTKILTMLVITVLVFVAHNFIGLAIIACFVVGAIYASRLTLRQALQSLTPLYFIIVLTALFNLIFVQGGPTYVDWGWLKISEAGVIQTLFISLRLLLLLLGGSLLTLTTTNMAITEGFEYLLRPLKKLHLPVHEFAFILGIALRFLPEFAQEWQRITKAQQARGAKLTTSPRRSGLSSLESLLVPLFTSVFRHAETLSEAMEARCYHGSDNCTQLHPLHFKRSDIATFIMLGILAALVIATSILL